MGIHDNQLKKSSRGKVRQNQYGFAVRVVMVIPMDVQVR